MGLEERAKTAVAYVDQQNAKLEEGYNPMTWPRKKEACRIIKDRLTRFHLDFPEPEREAQLLSYIAHWRKCLHAEIDSVPAEKCKYHKFKKVFFDFEMGLIGEVERILTA